MKQNTIYFKTIAEKVAWVNDYVANSYSYITDENALVAYVLEDKKYYYFDTATINFIEDPIYNGNVLTGAGDPRGVVIPTLNGQPYLDTTNKVWYKSVGLTNSDWKVSTIESSGTEFILGTYHFDSDQVLGAAENGYVLTFENATGKIKANPPTGGGGGANLSIINNDIDSLEIDNSGGTNVILNDATTLLAGLLSAADKNKLDNIEANATADMTGAQIKTAYELEADTNAYTDAEKTKLSSIATGAEVNVNADWTSNSGDSQILNKPTDLTDLSSHNVTELADVTDAGSGIIISGVERTKLNGIAAGAEVNVQCDWDELNTSSDAFIKNKPAVLVGLAGHSVTELDDVSDAGSGIIISVAERTKLNGINAGAEVNVNADWTSNSGDSQILNKPTDLTDLSSHSVTELNDVTNAGSGIIISGIERTKLNGIETAAELNTASSVSDHAAGGKDIYKQKVGSDLEFKGIRSANSEIVITEDTKDVIIGIGTLNADDLGTGSIPDGRVPASNVTQHVASLDHNSLNNYRADEHKRLNDATTTGDNLWSAQKINNELTSQTHSIADITNLQSSLDAKENLIRTINTRSSNGTISISDNGKTFFVTATSTLTLPTPSAGLHYTFFLNTGAAKTLKLTVADASAQKISSILGDTTLSTPYLETSTVGASVEVEAISATQWFVKALQGSFSIS